MEVIGEERLGEVENDGYLFMVYIQSYAGVICEINVHLVDD